MSVRRCLGGVPDEEIRHFEHDNGVELPAPYRAFLRSCGAGIVNGREIYGLGVGGPGAPNLRWLLEDLTRDGFVRPPDLMPIAETGDGSYICLRCPTGDVLFWEPTRDPPARVNPSRLGCAELLR